MHTDFDKVEIKYIGGDKERKIVRATEGSAGFDLYACERMRLEADEKKKMSTGVAVWIKDPSYAGIISIRSGISHKYGIILENGIGLIDSDFQGQIQLSLRNTSYKTYIIDSGERIAQLFFVRIGLPEFVTVTEFSETTTRAGGGFGSTDKQSIDKEVRELGRFRQIIKDGRTVFDVGVSGIKRTALTHDEFVEMVPEMVTTVGYYAVHGDTLEVSSECEMYKSMWQYSDNVWRMKSFVEPAF